LRTFTIDRWNWSERAGKWVYVTLKNGKRKYSYQLEPPQEFIDLTMKMKSINEKLMNSQDQNTKETLFKELQKLAKQMQRMGR